MKNTKQIEEMAKDLASSIVWQDLYDDEVTVDTKATSVKMRDKGYRKASDVAREIFEEIEQLLGMFPLENYCAIVSLVEIAELKKKYTESEDTE